MRPRLALATLLVAFASCGVEQEDHQSSVVDLSNGAGSAGAPGNTGAGGSIASKGGSSAAVGGASAKGGSSGNVSSGSSGASGKAGASGGGGAAGAAGGSAGAGGEAAGAAGQGGDGGGGGGAGQGGEGGSAAGSAGAGQGGSAGAAGAAPGPCGCMLGDGPYCGARAKALAAEQGCELSLTDGHANDLLSCDAGTWKLLEDCPGACDYTEASSKLDDACALPVCDCFVAVAWCGSGAAKEAASMGCRIPLLPEHNGDILYCPGGNWGVKEECSLGCIEAPKGTPDSCKSKGDYKAPFDCASTRTCSNGNHTSTHTGKDEYAYDFAMPVGTTVRAMRDGTVLRVRNVSSPGDACYDSGSSSCANYANTVEIKHSDGTVALYMHLSKGTVSKGQQVKQGDVLGKSGNSGWSTGPHLHVQVQQDCGIWWCQSIPFKLVEDATVSKGTAVTSENCP